MYDLSISYFFIRWTWDFTIFNFCNDNFEMSIFPVAWTIDFCQVLLSYINQTYTDSVAFSNSWMLHKHDLHIFWGCARFTYICFRTYDTCYSHDEKKFCDYFLFLCVIVCLLIHFCTSIIYLPPPPIYPR